MLNLNELESQWLRYKIKSFLPHFLILISISLILIIFISMDFDEKPVVIKTKNNTTTINQHSNLEKNTSNLLKQNDTLIPKIVIKEVNTPNIEQINVKKVDTLKSTTPILKQPEKLVLKPSLDFIRTMKEHSPNYYNSYAASKNIPKKKKKIIQKISSPKIEEVILDTQVKEVETSKEVEKVIEVKKEAMKIQRQDTQDDIQHVVKRFKQSNNPALSLFIAKKYYALKNYNQSYNYALLTNQLNNDIEESWIIFAKSLYKLNKKDKAINMLKQYIDTSHSHRAKILLDNIKSGKIK
ncbi:CDC27 family protein [Sulfurimonas sp.]|nr:CDC27 family protein [Sulfurimonas sp.]